MKKVIAFVMVAVFAALAVAVWLFMRAQSAVSIEKNVVYGHTGGVDLKLDLARPAAGNGPAPVIMCIHGGGWMTGSKNDYEQVIRQFAAAGYVAAAVEYRFAPKSKWPAQVEDVKCAVRYLRAHATELNLDPNKFGAIGDSAGGHLALLLGLMDPKDGMEGDGGNPTLSSKVQAVVNVYGPSDLKTWHVLAEAEAAAAKSFGKSSENMLADFVGTSDRSSSLIAQASPVTYINAGDPPILTFHGTKDPIVPFDQASALQAALESSGVTHEFYPLEGGVHGLSFSEVVVVTKKTLTFFGANLKDATTPEAGKPADRKQANN